MTRQPFQRPITIGELFDRQPPSAPEAEESLLGSMIHDPDVIQEVTGIIGRDGFSRPLYGGVFECLVDIHRQCGACDILILAQRVVDRGLLDAATAADRLVQFVESVPCAANAVHYARIIARKAHLRSAIGIAGMMLQTAYDDPDDPDSVISAAEDSIRALKDHALRESKLVFTPLSELDADEEIDWIWHGYLARGHVSLMTGLWKAGKTTLIGHLLRAMGQGGELAGCVHPARVLVVTEESRMLWRRRRDKLEIGDYVHLDVRRFKGRPSLGEWETYLARIAQAIEKGPGYDLVIFDTLADVSPVENENDAAQVQQALRPLRHLTEAGAAVLLVHHPRKGEGNQGQAARGSGALTGFVDIIIELRRHNPAVATDRRRVLDTYSRFDESPREQVIELKDDGYHLVGTRSDAGQSDRRRIIDSLLPRTGDGATCAEILEDWPEDEVTKPGKRTLGSDLSKGSNEGWWNRTGGGKKGDPYRHTRFDPILATATSKVRESNTSDREVFEI